MMSHPKLTWFTIGFASGFAAAFLSGALLELVSYMMAKL